MKKNEVKSLAREALRNREKEARKEIEYKYRAWKKEIDLCAFENSGIFEPSNETISREAREVYADYQRDIKAMEAEIIALSKDLEAA